MDERRRWYGFTVLDHDGIARKDWLMGDRAAGTKRPYFGGGGPRPGRGTRKPDEARRRVKAGGYWGGWVLLEGASQRGV